METTLDGFSTLRSLLSQSQNVRVDDNALNSSIFLALSNILNSFIGKTGYIISTINLQLLEDLFMSKTVLFIKSFQNVLISIYSRIIEISSGYIVRSILTSMIVSCNGKVTNILSKDCAVIIIGIIMESKFSDCGSQVNEAVQCLAKLCKGVYEGFVRASVFRSLSSVVIGGGVKIPDLHSEIIKLLTKFCTDKSPEVRYAIAVLIKSVVKNSSSSIPTESLLIPSIKGVEDEIATVQDAFSASLATIFIEQINVGWFR